MDLSWIYRPAQALQIGNFWEVTGRQQAGPYLSGLVCWPHYSFQHLQNCCLTNKMVVESARALIRLRAGIVKRLLKETASGASSNFNRHARGSIYMLPALTKAPNWFASAGSLQLSVWGAVPEAQAGLYWSCLDCRPCCSSQQMQNC